MAKVTIYDMTGKSVGERELNDAIFAVTPNKAVLHEVVKNYLANQRQGCLLYTSPSPRDTR